MFAVVSTHGQRIDDASFGELSDIAVDVGALTLHMSVAEARDLIDKLAELVTTDTRRAGWKLVPGGNTTQEHP